MHLITKVRPNVQVLLDKTLKFLPVVDLATRTENNILLVNFNKLDNNILLVNFNNIFCLSQAKMFVKHMFVRWPNVCQTVSVWPGLSSGINQTRLKFQKYSFKLLQIT